MTLLEIRNLKMTFRHEGMLTKVLDGVNFGVGEDEVVGLVGESGSGKTVTALSIMNLVPPEGRIETGEILFEGRDTLRLNKKDLLDIRGKKISMIFQEPFTSLNPVLPIGEQIMETFITHKSATKKEAALSAKELLAKVQIADPERIFSDYPHRLSGGERQRVMIAMALALRPKLLIADEPTSALDVTIQSEILKLILRLKEELRMSVLFITHDLSIMNDIAQTILVMKDGCIVESGKKDDIMRSPSRPYTKKLLEAIPRIEKGEPKEKINGKPLITVKAVSKSFPIERGPWRIKSGEVKALDDVSIILKGKETLGLVGESASGKTTLGKVILGLLEADSGEIMIEDKILRESLKTVPKKIRQMMQIVFQDPYGSLDPRMRMEDIILEGPDILGVGKEEKEEILKDVLSKVSLEYKDRLKFPHQFSGGQRQRIAIARALAVKPKILVLDEPVSSLDLLIQAEILRLLKALQDNLGLTYLFISHDLRVVAFMSDDVAVMHKGKIVEFGPKDSIYNNPQHPYTKRLLASLP